MGVDEIELENIIIYHNHEYKQKLDLGKKIYEIIHKNDVYPNSLIPERKEALDIYMKESVESFPTNVELKPWQIELMKYIKLMIEKLSGLLEKMVMKEKIGSKNMLNLCSEHEKW